MQLFADPIPHIPDTGWRPPTTFPRLDNASAIAIDLETYDPNLKTKGPGWGRGDGHIVGISVGTPEGYRAYFPMRHEVGGGNFPPAQVLQWCRRELSRPGQPKIGANLQYDTGWLLEEGVEVKGPLIDVQYAEALLDEHARGYALEDLAQKYLGEGKIDEALYQWLSRAYGGPATREAQAKNIYRAPVTLVGPYAISDIDLPIRIWNRQRPLLAEQNLIELFEMECELIPILVAMRMRGTPINMQALDPNIDTMHARKKEALKALRKLAGFDVDPNVTDTLVRAFDNLGIAYPKTPKGNPSFRKDFLENHPHEIGHHIREVRRWEKYIQYAESYRDMATDNGILHGSYHPLRGEDGGTVVGRFSSSNPNLTNIPKRDPEAKALLRGIFAPWPGERWRSMDFSQIQFRIMVHYAHGAGAEEARAKYHADPHTDYHDMVKALILEMSGVVLERGPVKNINFGLAFTMGLDKLARELGKSVAETKALLESYHSGMPWLKHTTEIIAARAEERGYIFGIGGRRHRFPLWEPKCWALKDYVRPNVDRDVVDMQIAELVRNPPKGLKRKPYAGSKRAYTHLGLNRLAQDGEGTTVKRAMVECWKQGIYDVLGVPLNTVHDEKNMSDPMTTASEEAFMEMKRILETTTKWNVPILVSDEVGPDWANLSAIS